MAKGNITINIEEYKELLLKEKPTDNDRVVLKRIFDIIEPKLEFNNERYSSYKVMEDVKVEDSITIIKEIFTMLKYVDFDKYMEIWNKVMTNEREKKAKLETVNQMNKAKELRKEEY